MTEITDLTKAVKELTRELKKANAPVVTDQDASVADAPGRLVEQNNTTDGYLPPKPRLSSQAGVQSFQPGYIAGVMTDDEVAKAAKRYNIQQLLPEPKIVQMTREEFMDVKRMANLVNESVAKQYGTTVGDIKAAMDGEVGDGLE